MSSVNVSVSMRNLTSLLSVILFLASCMPYTPPPPPPPQFSTTPVLQYSVANVSPEGISVDNGALKVYLDTQSGIAQWRDYYGYHSEPYSKTRHRAAGTITLSMPDAAISFSLTPTSLGPSYGQRVESNPFGLHVLLKNRGTRVISLDWNSVVLTDEVGRALRVIHQGVKLSDRTAPLAPSIIPPGSILEDFIYPSEHIQYASGWYGSAFFETRQIGVEIKLYLPLKLGAEEKPYTFAFRVEALKE